MPQGSVARRYARALILVAAAEDRVDAVTGELGAFAALLTRSPDLATVLGNPVFGREERRAVLDRVIGSLKLSPSVEHFLRLLIDKNRIGYAADIARAFAGLADERAGRLRAEVRSARPLSKEFVERLTRVLAERTGKRIVVEASVDPSLIGGVVTRVGDTVYDGTVLKELGRLCDELGCA